MSEKCPYCGKFLENTRALGSHIHYNHETQSWASLSQKRSENEKEQFKKLLDGCLTDRGLPKSRRMDNVEEVVTEIPEGVSDTIDHYREALRCAIRKEKLVKEFEKEFLKESSEEKE